MFRNLLVALLAAAAASNTTASAKCPSVPEAQWQPRQVLGTKLIGQRCKVRNVQDECCAVYGVNESHNPLGGWMVLVSLATLLARGASDWMMTPDSFFDEVWLEQVHEALATGLLGLLAFHGAGAVLIGLKHRENLIAAMTSGRKRPPTGTDIA